MDESKPSVYGMNNGIWNPENWSDEVSVVLGGGMTLLGVVEVQIRSMNGKSFCCVTRSSRADFQVGDYLISVDGVTGRSGEHFRDELFFTNESEQFIVSIKRPKPLPQPEVVAPGQGVMLEPGSNPVSSALADAKGDPSQFDISPVPGAVMDDKKEYEEEVEPKLDLGNDHGEEGLHKILNPQVSQEYNIEDWSAGESDEDWSDDGGEPNPEPSPLNPEKSTITLEDVLASHPAGFSTNTDIRPGAMALFQCIIVLRYPNTPLTTLQMRGSDIQLREGTYERCRQGKISEEELENLADPVEWASEEKMTTLAKFMSCQIKLWEIYDNELLERFTTPAVEVAEGDFDDQGCLNILWCHKRQHLQNINRNHFLPLIPPRQAQQTLGGHVIVWPEDMPEEGGDHGQWENETMSEISEALPQDIEDQLRQMEIIHKNQDVTIGVLIYTKDGSEIGLIKAKDEDSYNIPHGDFLKDTPLESLHYMLDEHMYIYDQKCFGVLPRVLNVTQNKKLIIIYPAICNCEIYLINQLDLEWVWLSTKKIQHNMIEGIPGSMTRIIAAGADLLDRFREELPPVESRIIREEAVLAMHRMFEVAQFYKSQITLEEFFNYFIRHPSDRQTVLENLYEPYNVLKHILPKVPHWLMQQQQTKFDYDRMDKEVPLDFDDPNAIAQEPQWPQTETEAVHMLYLQMLQEDINKGNDRYVNKSNDRYVNKSNDRYVNNNVNSRPQLPRASNNSISKVAKKDNSHLNTVDVNQDPFEDEKKSHVAPKKDYKSLKNRFEKAVNSASQRSQPSRPTYSSKPSRNVRQHNAQQAKPAEKIYYRVLKTFKTKGHPVETIQEGWNLELRRKESNMVLVDHPKLRYLQWIGRSDWDKIEIAKAEASMPVQQKQAEPEPSAPAPSSAPQGKVDQQPEPSSPVKVDQQPEPSAPVEVDQQPEPSTPVKVDQQSEPSNPVEADQTEPSTPVKADQQPSAPALLDGSASDASAKVEQSENSGPDPVKVAQQLLKQAQQIQEEQAQQIQEEQKKSDPPSLPSAEQLEDNDDFEEVILGDTEEDELVIVDTEEVQKI